jgi:hypothetical protein
LSQNHGPAGRHLQRLGLVRQLEVIDVAPVRRHRLVQRLAFQEFRHRGMFADTVAAEHKQVVALVLDAHAETDGIHGARLADDGRQLFQVGGCLKVKLGGVAHAVEAIRLNAGLFLDGRVGSGHNVSDNFLLFSVMNRVSSNDAESTNKTNGTNGTNATNGRNIRPIRLFVPFAIFLGFQGSVMIQVAQSGRKLTGGRFAVNM